MFKNPADPVPTQDLLYAFYLGTKFDLRLCLYVLIPLFLLGWIKWFSPFYNRFTHHVWLTYLVLVTSAVLIFYLLDFGHYAYLNKRVDATVLRFLANFSTSTQMVWQSYPVIPWSLFVIFLISLNAYVVHRLILYFRLQPAMPLKVRHKLWVAPLSIFIFIFAIFGKFSYYPLRWSDAFFSPNAYASSIASNPVLYFFNTLKNKEIQYSAETAREYYDVISQYLALREPDKTKLNYTRHIPAKPIYATPPNVVMVFLESFASYKTGAFGNKLNPTPNFDEIERNSLSFRHFYTPAVGTARSVFAAITGLPDIELNKTSSRNPLVVSQKTVINTLDNYEKFYFIGGSANWGNIRGVLQHNIAGLHLYEEGNYTLPRMDVWGLDDASLFIEANWVLRKQTKPFFAIIQTAGNHRPYHIPEESYGFERKNLKGVDLHKHGFIGEDEFNAFSFMDHSIGHFMKEARKEPYFDSTIFVFFGDHGITGYPGEHSPAYLAHTYLSGMQTPLVFYAPKLIKPKQIELAASELDIIPTVAGLTGQAYTNTTLGRDLTDEAFAKDRYAFTIEHAQNSVLNMVSADYIFSVHEDGSGMLLNDLRSADTRKNVVAEHKELADNMRKLAIGFLETTKYIMHNNQADLSMNRHQSAQTTSN